MPGFDYLYRSVELPDHPLVNGPLTEVIELIICTMLFAPVAVIGSVASSLVKFGALGFIFIIDPQFSLDLQLIGGVIILQTMPAVGIGLLSNWSTVPCKRGRQSGDTGKQRTP